MMTQLLAKHTQMQVSQVRSETPVQPNHVYVIPPNTVLTVEGSILRVAPPIDPRGKRAFIDTFFRSLAADQGERAVCILLSGSGSDGTLGLRAVKEHGGMAQTMESARHDGIPRSAISTGLVDYVLPVAKMPGRLLDYARHLDSLRESRADSSVPESVSDQLGKIYAALRRRTGHDFSRYKENTVIRRVQRRMQVLQMASLEEYVELVRTNQDEQDRLFNDLLIGVTHFFRDPEAFHALAGHVIPKIFEGKDVEDEVRVCVVGCATGEEAYSIAILLAEFMSGLEKRLHVKIFGTDIDEESLELARFGRYPAAIEEHVSRERLDRFFIEQDGVYQVKKDIREMCIFSAHSIIKDPPFSRLDLLACRNLLIYFASDVQRRLIPLFHYALARDGFLFLGPSENISANAELFRTIDKRYRIFQRREAVSRPPVSFPLEDTSLSSRYAAPRQRQRRFQESSLGNIIERSILRNYAPACVVINERGEAAYFSGRTGKYLEPAEGEPSVDIVSMAREGLRPSLRAAIHRAIKTNTEVVQENIAVAMDGTVQNVNLTIRPMREFGDDAGLYIVVFQDVGLPRSKEAGAEPPLSSMDEAVAHLEVSFDRQEKTCRPPSRSWKRPTRSSNPPTKSCSRQTKNSNHRKRNISR